MAASKGKNTAKQPTIISLLDSDDDDEVVLVGSSKPGMRAEPPKSELVWKKMTIPEKMDALKRERKCLRKAHESCEDEKSKKFIMTRRNELRALSAGLMFKIWEPPSPALFKAIPFHKYDMSEALRATIKAPAPHATEPSAQTQTTQTSSTTGGAKPFGYGSTPWAATQPASTSTAGIADNGTPSAVTRAPSDMSGRAADALQAVNSTFDGLVNSMKSFAEGAGNLLNHPFANRLASGGMGPSITGLPGPSSFSGGFPGLPDFMRTRVGFDEELGFEFDRPAE